MIISSSRRTDIPAFYSQWFINRLREGFCLVQNPINPSLVSRICLEPDKVDAIVFWTRNAAPILSNLAEMDRLGYRYFFLYTVMANPRFLDPHCPGPEEAIQSFRKLSLFLGPERVIWRYDPIVFTAGTDCGFHLEAFKYLASRLGGFTRRVVISLVQEYRRNSRRLRNSGAGLIEVPKHQQNKLLESLAYYAEKNNMEIFSCAAPNDMSRLGIKPGKCIDPDYMDQMLGVEVDRRKDPGQRPSCGCAASRDIGVYDTCIYGCRYCYGTTSLQLARRRLAAHDPLDPMLGREK